MLIAVTTTGKIALAVAAGLFIVFAIASSFYFPRRNADYPGNRLGGFVALSVLLFVVLMGAMVAFAGESEEEHAGGETTETHAVTETTGTETGETETGETETEGEGGGEGDAAAGESIFADNGCGSCHTLEAAGSSGSIGPGRDDAPPAVELVVGRVTNGAGAMPSFADSLDEQQIRDVAAYVVESTSG